jgi:chromosome segregation ATPase
MRCVFFLLLLTGAAAINESPIQKVVKLVTQMKDQTTKEGEADLEAYDKYKCWCETTTAEKTAAIEAAETKLEELGSFVEEAAAKEGELKTEIAGLEEDIASDTTALQTASKTRSEQNADFETEAADFKETIGLLEEAVATLSKVQLIQKPEAHKEALLQVKGIVHRMAPKFQNVMQKDLFDMLGEFQTADQQREKAMGKNVEAAAFLGEVFLPKREATVLVQNHGLLEGKQPTGAAAGAKSYNSRSGGILGLLKTQEEQFTRNLAKSTKEEGDALAAFNKLAASKNGEIAAATQQKDDKSVELAELMDKASKAKEDIDATSNALAADQKFLKETTKSCTTEEELYARRSKTRNEEIVALGETLDILTGDEARALFDKTISFIQVISGSTATMKMQEKAKSKAMQRLLMMSKKSKNWMLASLAVRVKLDAFGKVKKAMDTMLAELKTQQKAEYAKWEQCKKDIDTTEDKIWNGKVEKRDLGEKHKDIMNTLAVGDGEIKDLKTQVAEAEVALKKAGEQRKADNGLFQTSMADQRATIAILQMAAKRLKAFYEPKAALLQVRLHANPPPTPSGPEAVGYSKSSSSGGVMGLLDMIIADTKRTVEELNADEQQSQADYGEFVSTTTASVQADREAIAEKEEQLASAKSEKSETEESQMANQGSLDKLADLLTGIHNQCDFVLKYFDIRQKSRSEEMEAIEEAKAILSGANFA